MQSPSPRACQYNTGYCLIIFDTELYLHFILCLFDCSQECFSFLLSGQADFLQSGTVCGHPKWLGLSRLCWLETKQGSRVTAGESIKKLEDVTYHFGDAFFLDWPLSVLLSVLFLICFSGGFLRGICFLQPSHSLTLADPTPRFKVAEWAEMPRYHLSYMSQSCLLPKRWNWIAGS